ncbi:MAG: FecR domain-containing protein [Gaiellaceae bacterium]
MPSGAVLLFAAILLASSGCGGGGPEAGTQTGGDTGTTTGTSTATTETGTTSTEVERCVEEEGVITGYLEVVQRDCGPVLRQETIFRADRLSTGPGGTLEFDTREIAGCKLRPEAAVLIRPDAATALRLLAGAIACDAETGGETIRLEAPGAEIEVTGTLFTLIAGGDNTTVRVHEGTVRVLSTADPDIGWRELSANGPEAAGVVSVAQPLEVVEYQLEEWEPELLQTLKLGIVTLPPGELPALTRRAARSGSVVTETEAQAGVLKERNLVQHIRLVTTAELGGERRRQFVQAGDTVVGVGSFSDLLATFAGLREAFGPEVTLVYTPFAFPEEEETTSTETSTDSTETTSP